MTFSSEDADRTSFVRYSVFDHAGSGPHLSLRRNAAADPSVLARLHKLAQILRARRFVNGALRLNKTKVVSWKGVGSALLLCTVRVPDVH